MSRPDSTVFSRLSRRERQVMEILYARGQASATQIYEALPDRPSFSAARSVIRTLEEKGHIRHEEKGLKYVYAPVTPREKESRPALAQLVATFFQGSPSRLMAALLDESKIDAEELKSIEAMIRRAKERRK